MGRQHVQLLVAIAVVGVWLGARIAFFNGYYTEDAPGYVGDALSIAAGEYGVRNHVNGLNIGTYAPVAVPLLMFGKSEAALSVWPLLCSLLGMASVAGISGMLFGPAYAALAALLYAIYPGDVFFSTVVMPDAIQSGWLSFSLLLVVASYRPAAGHRARWLFAAGVAMGICHIIRANGALLLPIGMVAVGVFSLADRERTSGRLPWAEHRLGWAARWCAIYASGWAVVLLTEAMVYGWAAGDPLFRLHVVDQHYGSAASIQRWGLNTHPLTIPYSAFAPLMWINRGGWGQLNQDQAYHGLVFTWGAIGILAGALALAAGRRNLEAPSWPAWAMASFWLMWPLLYHQFGTQSLFQFVPIHRLSRHLVVYAPGAIIATVAGCCALWNLARGPAARTALAIVGTGALAATLTIALKGETIAYDAYHHIKDTYARIRDHLPPGTTLVVGDPGDLGFFDFWLNPIAGVRVGLMPFAAYPTCATLPSAIVLTWANPGWQGLSAPVIQETVARLPCLLAPPASWRLLYQGHQEKVYVVP